LRQQFTSEQNTSLQTIQKQSNDLSQLNYEKLESLAEIDSLRKQCKDLETALESRRHAQELEIKRLTLTIDSLRDDHVKASSDVSSVSSQLADLQTELTTWKQRADQKDREISTLTTTVDTLEQKCARMSNVINLTMFLFNPRLSKFAAESKAATQETMRMLSERASSFAAEKDKAEDRVAELAQKLSEKNREIDHLRLDHVKSEDTIAELNREKSELDEEVSCHYFFLKIKKKFFFFVFCFSSECKVRKRAAEKDRRICKAVDAGSVSPERHPRFARRACLPHSTGRP